MANQNVHSVCPYCGVGCGIVMQVQNNKVVKVVGDKDHPTNFGRLCTKGTTCGQAIAESGRMENAYLRENREHDPVRIAMDTAIDETAGRLRHILDRDGPDALAFYVSGQMSLEAQYLINKLAKGFVRTRNIESNSRLCMASAGSGYKLSLGSDGPPGSYEDFDRADLFFVIGANMADCHPILFLRMMDRVKAGAKLIVVDPRRSATADKANLYLPVKPGTDLALLNGLLHLLVKNGHTDPAFIAAFTEGWEAMPGFLEDYPPHTVAQITGLAEADIRQAAEWIGHAAEWMSCWTMGLNQSTHGTWNTNALCNLHLATGAICRPRQRAVFPHRPTQCHGWPRDGLHGPGPAGATLGAGGSRPRLYRGPVANPPRQPAARSRHRHRGAVRADGRRADQGVLDHLHQPGRQRAEPSDRDRWPARRRVGDHPGRVPRHRDQPLRRHPAARRAVGRSRRGDDQLRAQPDPDAKSRRASRRDLADWQIIAQVACAMGFAEAFTYASASEVFEEIKRAWNPKTGYDIRGASYARLRQQPLQWPLATADAPARNPIRYRDHGTLAFATDSGKVSFSRARTCRRRKCPMTPSPSCSTPVACSTSGTP